VSHLDKDLTLDLGLRNVVAIIQDGEALGQCRSAFKGSVAGRELQGDKIADRRDPVKSVSSKLNGPRSHKGQWEANTRCNHRAQQHQREPGTQPSVKTKAEIETVPHVASATWF